MTDEREQEHDYFLVHEDLYEARTLWNDQPISLHVNVRWGAEISASSEEAALKDFEAVVQRRFADGPPDGAEAFPAMDEDYTTYGIPRDVQLTCEQFFNLGAGGDSWIWKIDGVEIGR
jgi:hypothetical protein